ncbi:hypothetical protein ACWCOW_41265, partial [Streptomyces sp. NPDC001939]
MTLTGESGQRVAFPASRFFGRVDGELPADLHGDPVGDVLAPVAFERRNPRGRFLANAFVRTSKRHPWDHPRGRGDDLAHAGQFPNGTGPPPQAR